MQLIGKTDGAGTRKRLTEKITQVQEPEGAEAIGRADHHQPLPGERRTVGVERR